MGLSGHISSLEKKMTFKTRKIVDNYTNWPILHEVYYIPQTLDLSSSQKGLPTTSINEKKKYFLPFFAILHTFWLPLYLVQ